MSGRFDAREIFRTLAEHRVAYVTVGGIAVQAHGGQRMTQDLDVIIATSSGNYARLAAALDELDARILGPGGQYSAKVPTAALLSGSDQWHLVTPHGRLDVLTSPAHLGSFDELRSRAHEVQVDGNTVVIAHRHDLLELKRVSGRPQDLADIKLLESLEAVDEREV